MPRLTDPIRVSYCKNYDLHDYHIWVYDTKDNKVLYGFCSGNPPTDGLTNEDVIEAIDAYFKDED